MSYLKRRVLGLQPSRRDPRRSKSKNGSPTGGDEGFTLVELLIVITVLPLVVGAISVGLISVFSLQSGVSSRLSHTADAQVVAANFAKDVQGAAAITTASSSNPECGAGTGTQLMGLQYNLDTTQSDPTVGQYQYNVSYRSVPVTSNGTTTYSLERFYCNNYSQNLVSTSVLAYDLSSSQSVPALTCVQNPVPLNAC
ncbi:MAG: prepilin-type N-terminal cleavage/methylation domain-containing protein, partial [Acidimicrobiaceae bacterium]|nr:prepilin-type N-terminal cleavage/methylation domain-containing protein [Acidimicrobiaceae bacterium]